ncbi:choice-of-anchor V domain-containing protein [Candidatus Leptofilum sp.]|uniref:choice-of-anchor V domain-containing protein n=1 Tax=Candidatus Leptofilum sp. TaxID=3241576 RepID=UPI003B5A60E8
MNSTDRRSLGKLIPLLVICIITIFTVTLFSQMANARSSGIAGLSGASGSHCSVCHGGGTEPTVTISGPAVAFTGEVFTYTLTVAGGQEIAAGLDVAVTGGVLTDTLAGSLYTKILSGEIVHENGDDTQKSSPNFPSYDGHDGGPKCINSSCTEVPGGEVTFTFNWVAPATAETVTMYGAGNSVDLSEDTSGDAAATDTLTITVIDPATLTESLYLPLIVTD